MYRSAVFPLLLKRAPLFSKTNINIKKIL